MMQLRLNPRFQITRHKSSIILHNASLYGANCIVRSISAKEAIILSLYNGTRSLRDVCAVMACVPCFSANDINEVKSITEEFTALSVLIPNGLAPEGSPQISYNPLDFSFDAKIKPAGARLEQPLAFTYLTTLSCNRLCRYCYADAYVIKNEPKISLERLLEVVDEAYSLGIRSINISGGEPFLRTDLTDILEYMLGKGIYPQISTKAALSDRTVRRLRMAGLRDIQVSLDSADPKEANFLVGSPRYYDQIIRTIKLLVAHGIEVRVNCVLTAYNIRRVPDLFALAARLGVSEVNLSPYTRSLGRNDDDLFPSQTDMLWLRALIPQLKEKHRALKIAGFFATPSNSAAAAPPSLPSGLRCTIGVFAFILLPNGDVSVCERLEREKLFVIGNLNKQSIMEMWSSPKWDCFSFSYQDRRRYSGTKCFECDEFELCTKLGGRCLVTTKAAYGRYFGPEPDCQGPFRRGIGTSSRVSLNRTVT